MKKLKIDFILITLFILLLSCSDDNKGSSSEENKIQYPKKEMRAVWLATVGSMDWPSNKGVEEQKLEYIEYLETFKKYNINTVMVQIRPMADAFYDSPLEPWSEYITGKQGQNPGYDVLQFMIDEAHKRDIEFHAWLNPYRISNNVDTFNPSENHIYRKHKEWTMTYNKLLIFRPALPEVRSFFKEVVRDVITKYDVDGIHFDDYFYPYPSKGVELDDKADYEKYGTGYANIEDFRRGNVNKVIEDMHNLIKEVRPDILFSVSPYAVWRSKAEDPINGSATSGLNNYDGLYADIRLWCEKGWIDFVVPQLYASTENTAANFIKLSEWWPKNSFDTPVLIGYGLYKFGVKNEGDIFMKPIELETQFFYGARQKKIEGSVLFNATAFKVNRIDILSTLAKIYDKPAVVPFMGRTTEAEPRPVTNLIANGDNLQWHATGNNLRYVVYKITDNKAEVIAITEDKNIKLSEGDYCVSVINRDNKESLKSKIINCK